MAISDIVAALDAEIGRLHEVKKLLVSGGSSVGNGMTGRIDKPRATDKPKRVFSSAALARMRDGQRKRWAKQKRAAK